MSQADLMDGKRRKAMLQADRERIDPEEPGRKNKSNRFDSADYNRNELAAMVDGLLDVAARNKEPQYFVLRELEDQTMAIRLKILIDERREKVFQRRQE